MLPEVKAIEPQLKQILYGCVEHVQATKAALYLSASHDLNDKRYELVTSYQYNSADRKSVSANDDLVDRLVVKRSPFFVNGLGTDMRFSEMLFRQGNDRMLVAPLFSRGRLVGFIDMRDKAGKKPFEGNDLEAAKAIPGAVLACFSAMGHLNNPQSIVAIATVSDDAMEMMQTHLQAWLERTHQAQLVTRPHLIYPFGVQVVPVTAAGISSILSAP